MGGPSNRAQSQDMSAWMRDVERRLLTQERRSTRYEVQRALGPGFGKSAQQVFDWNDERAWLAGQFFSAVGAFNSPDGTKPWLGTIRVAATVGGVQELVSLDGTLVRYQRSFMFNLNGTPTFSAWSAL